MLAEGSEIILTWTALMGQNNRLSTSGGKFGYGFRVQANPSIVQDDTRIRIHWRIYIHPHQGGFSFDFQVIQGLKVQGMVNHLCTFI
jgi:hypothetical protein